MKVIMAGYGKTGTKTMNAALTELGYEVYDYFDHFWYHGEQWNKIFTQGATTKDIKEMYENVDAVVDVPAFYIWEEIHRAFPDAKIILTVRDEESWFKSLNHFVKLMNSNRVINLIQIFTPTGWQYCTFVRNFATFVVGMYMPFGAIAMPRELNKLIACHRYRQHNCYVLQTAPKDKLLVFNVQDGWEPLCKFLGKNIPDKPFPHKNKKGQVATDPMPSHKATQRMKRELFVSVSLLLGVSTFALYKLYKNWNTMSLPKLFQCEFLS